MYWFLFCGASESKYGKRQLSIYDKYKIYRNNYLFYIP